VAVDIGDGWLRVTSGAVAAVAVQALTRSTDRALSPADLVHAVGGGTRSDRVDRSRVVAGILSARITIISRDILGGSEILRSTGTSTGGGGIARTSFCVGALPVLAIACHHRERARQRCVKEVRLIRVENETRHTRGTLSDHAYVWQGVRTWTRDTREGRTRDIRHTRRIAVIGFISVTEGTIAHLILTVPGGLSTIHDTIRAHARRKHICGEVGRPA